jgi:hypothetical protein
LYGLSRLGASMSVLDFLHMGSAVSIRSFMRIGAAMAVFGIARLGSSIYASWCLHVDFWFVPPRILDFSPGLRETRVYVFATELLPSWVRALCLWLFAARLVRVSAGLLELWVNSVAEIDDTNRLILVYLRTRKVRVLVVRP